tara:strand:+ start:1393 stop:2097 length:705 start_codon:yes stop_codon:yes gene_type:complete
MSYNQQPRAVTDGLIFCIDAANPKCFNTGETTAKDLVQGFELTGANGEPGTGTHTPDTANFPAFNGLYGGIFDFNGGRGMNVEGDLGSHSTQSISMWYYKNSDGVQYFTDARNDGGTWFLSNYTTRNINYANALYYNFDVDYDADNGDFINRWQHMVVTSNSGGSQLFVDGTKRTLLGSSSYNENLGVNFRIGTRFTTASEWTGYMGPIHIYNRVLSDAEVAQNFNAFKGRFAI